MSLAMRNEVPVELTWDLSLIYPTEEAMYRDVEKMKALCASMEERFKGKLTTPEAICDCLNDLQEMTRLMTLTGNYTDLAVSVDYYDSHNQERNDRVMNIISDINSRLSFINSEITEQSEETLKASIAIAGGSRIYLEDILRRKPHQLHPETERALSALSQTLNTPYQIYNMTKLADMKFDSSMLITRIIRLATPCLKMTMNMNLTHKSAAVLLMHSARNWLSMRTQLLPLIIHRFRLKRQLLHCAVLKAYLTVFCLTRR